MATPAWRQEGAEPDYRFSLANERTFLAWVRTALAILAGAVLLHEFASRIEPRAVLLALCIALSVLSGVLGLSAYLRWKGNEIAMRHSRPLPHSRMIAVLSFAVLGLCLGVALLLAMGRPA